MGELNRMTQFKEKGRGNDSARVGLLTYPVLQAADILLYDAERVPVGDDQRQHVELTRDLAIRFNHRYGDTFVVPEGVFPTVGARVMDLQHPERKMSKSVNSPLGTIGMLDDPAEIDRKVRKAVTDTDGDVRYDPAAKPGLSNLLDLLAAATDRRPADVAAGYSRYGDLKKDLSDALVELLRPDPRAPRRALERSRGRPRDPRRRRRPGTRRRFRHVRRAPPTPSDCSRRTVGGRPAAFYRLPPTFSSRFPARSSPIQIDSAQPRWRSPQPYPSVSHPAAMMATWVTTSAS